MSTRALLSVEQRDRLFNIPVERAEMARHYVLGAEDLKLIGSKRRAPNRLGFAVQLCLLRYPGHGLGPSEHPPELLIAFVAEQISVAPSAFAEYAVRDQTQREHAFELQRVLGIQRFGFTAWRNCMSVGADAAWATDRGEPIVMPMLDHLRRTSTIIPAPYVLERNGLAARVMARRRTFEIISSGLTDEKRQAMDALLANDPEVGRSRFAWLRDCPESPAPSNMIENPIGGYNFTPIILPAPSALSITSIGSGSFFPNVRQRAGSNEAKPENRIF